MGLVLSQPGRVRVRGNREREREREVAGDGGLDFKMPFRGDGRLRARLGCQLPREQEWYRLERQLAQAGDCARLLSEAYLQAGDLNSESWPEAMHGKSGRCLLCTAMQCVFRHWSRKRQSGPR